VPRRARLLAFLLLPWLALTLTAGGMHGHHRFLARGITHDVAGAGADVQERCQHDTPGLDTPPGLHDRNGATCLTCLWQRTARGAGPASQFQLGSPDLTSIQAVRQIGVVSSCASATRTRAPPSA
jgi:hypothetical protein